MENNDLFKIWDESNQKISSNNPKITKSMVENYLKSRVSSVHLSFNISIIVTLAAFLASIVVLSINTYVYKDNPVMLSIELLMLALSVLFFLYGIYIYTKLREINNFSKSLLELISSKLRFLRSHYEVWLVILSLGMLFLMFGINTLVDNENGTYRINNLKSYLLINLIVLVFVYSINKISASMNIRKMKAYLTDIEANSIENAQKEDGKENQRRWIFIAIAIVVTLAIILGILKLLRIV